MLGDYRPHVSCRANFLSIVNRKARSPILPLATVTLLELLLSGGNFAECDVLLGSFEDLGWGSSTCFLDLEWAGWETGGRNVQ
jgi:hypothetical protein